MGRSAQRTGRRRVGGWGFEGESFPPTPQLLAWLEARLGGTEPSPPVPKAASLPSPRPLPPLAGALSQDPEDRLLHARGQGLPDLLRLRAGSLPAAPDAVARPRDAAEVEALLGAASADGVRVIPWGGGTSVTGGVNPPPGEAPVVTLDLATLAGVYDLDPLSGLARVGAGTPGPALESALAQHGLTLGHFPQSFELSTVGGWIATRASGQESLAYGGISELVAGLDLVAPAGRLSLPPWPASAAGPDLRQLVLGSEGRLGVITEAVVRVRRRPATTLVDAALLPDWETGLAASRELLQEGVPLALLRLSDEPETEVAVAVGLSGRRWLTPLVGGWLRLHGIRGRGCLLLVGAHGSPGRAREALAEARAFLGRHRAAPLGNGPGRRWLADRFRHPYLRDALLDRGIATDTLETAAPWSRLGQLTVAVREALADSVPGEGVAVLCHLSHPYRDGASLYFTFFFRCPRDPAEAVARWAALKRSATAALVAGGGTLSHHHGVGSWHAPWLGGEIGTGGVALLRAAASTFDPAGILNPHVLLDPTDRLET